MRCPNCSGENLHRSHSRPGRERLYRLLLPIYYFRCHDCGTRTARATRRALGGLLARAALALVVLAVAWVVLGILFGMVG